MSGVLPPLTHVSSLPAQKSISFYRTSLIHIEEIQVESHSDRKGHPGSVPKMEETVGLVSTYGEELLGG
jgi:hypothetical protein